MFYGSGYDDGDDEDGGGDEFPAEEAKELRSLAAAKPNYIKNDARARVSFLYPTRHHALYQRV